VSVSMLFLCGLAVTGIVSLWVVTYLHRPLQKLLVELCGNENRAEFWTAFSAVTVAAVPVIFALACPPVTDRNTFALFEIGSQLEWGLIGLVVSILLLGWIIGRFIPRVAPKA
jgi:uncharacterized membrane protein YhaH (DUF805 family)